MKTQRRFVTILLVVLMLFSLATTAFAEQGVNTNTGEGSITVTGAKEGKTYDIYRMFDLTGADTNEDGTFDIFSYTINPYWTDFFIGGAGAEYLVEKTGSNAAAYAERSTMTYNGKTYFIDITESNVGEVAQKALAYAVGLANTDGTETAATDGDLVFANIALGYYLVYPQGAADILDGNSSICSLTTTQPTAQVQAKADYPDIEKEVDDESVEVGQVVTFTVTGKVPDTTGYESYTYMLSDNMTEGLTFSEEIADMTVTFGTATITVPETGKVTVDYDPDDIDNGFTLTFDMTQYQDYKGQDITITYKAVVNDAAVCQITENSATLTYSNDPNNDEDKVTTPPIEVQVYSSKIVVDKVNSNGDKLADAKFVLFKTNGTTELFYKYTPATADAEATVTWVPLAAGETLAEAIAADKVTEVTTNASGAAEFAGLEDGTYYLRETVAPNGYNLLDHDVECVVEHITEASVSKPVGVSLKSVVENISGTILPGTGGSGVYIFYIVGGVLVLGAAVLLITKKRMKVKE